MLHLTNGDSAAEAIRSTGVGGDLLIWRDVLHEGPVPASASDAELREIRAGHIARAGWGEREEVLADFLRRDERLAAAMAAGEEVVLWFENDLFDQLQRLQVLERLSRARTRTRVTSVETDGYVALLSAQELMAAWARARSCGESEFDAARRAWRAFTADNPRSLEALAAGGEPLPIPGLAAALRRHLEQFPGLTDGLSRSERQAVEALAGGPLPFEELFDRAQRAEPHRFLGDLVFRGYLELLAEPPWPLVEADADREVWRLTEAGRRVLDGALDRLAGRRFDRWLGGTRLLAPHRVWRWDPRAGRLVEPTVTPAAG